MIRRALLLASLVGSSGCGSSADAGKASRPEASVSRDSLPDGLYHDFLDGKFDGAGHPLDAQVWQGEADCGALTGWPGSESLWLEPGLDVAETVCAASSKAIGLGRFVLNVRALVESACSDCDAPVLELAVFDASGNLIETEIVPWRSFVADRTWQNVSVGFTHSSDGAVSVRVRWLGEVAARVDYVELFRSTRSLLVTPVSGVPASDAHFQVEAIDPPQGFALRADCNGADRTAELEALLASGEATRTDTEFRALFDVPAAPLLSGCELPARVRFQVVTQNWVRATSRVTLYDQEPPCTFAPGAQKVLLTGFEPFPADSSRDNSSEQAVGAFDPASVPGISLMKLILPVEFDTAPSILASAIERCQPDVVVGFGQGRTEVDLETTAYNLKDSSAIAGGVPDNRGLVAGGQAIEPGGPAELSSELPLDAIHAGISARGIAVGYSDDPGRYVCNNLFYRALTSTTQSSTIAGFVHLPRIASVGDAERAMLADVVTEVVAASVAEMPR